MYQLAFDQEADHVIAERLNRSGVSLAESGKLEEAAGAFRQALAGDPSLWTAHNNLGIALARLRRFDQAAESFRRALARQPASAQVRNNLGNALAEMGRREEAVAAFEQALRLEPDYTDARFNLAKVLVRLGRHAEAAAQFQEVLAAQPGRAAAQRQLGLALSAQAKHDEAIRALRHALELDPDDAENHFQLGCALRHARRRTEAIGCFERAVRLRPDYFEALSALGITLTSEGRPERACEWFLLAAQRCGENPTLWCNWGIALAACGRQIEALKLYEKALEVKPDHAEVCNNTGTALASLRRFDEALAAYDRALAIKPDYADAHRNRGIVYLLLGDFERGWAEFEWRWKCQDFQAPEYSQPVWDGAPLDGKTILLRAEQGLGDTLQFIRFAPQVKARGGTVVARVQPALENLLARSPGIDRLVTDDHFREFDVYVPLMSLPRVLGTTFETIPSTGPYLFADEKLVEYWRARLGLSFARLPHRQDGNRHRVEETSNCSPFLDGQRKAESATTHAEGDGKDDRCLTPDAKRLGPNASPEACRLTPNAFMIGIAWQGNPRYPGDAERSVPLEYFAALAGVPRVRLVSLQRGHGREQLVKVAGKFLVSELPGEVDRKHGRFMDTAAIIKGLDLIVTSDSALVHLAGGLGVPVWMATAYASDWRWLRARDDSPWYPTLRLFRQPSPGDWTSVFEQMASELRRLTVARASSLVPRPRAQGGHRPKSKIQNPKSVGRSLVERGAALASSRKLREALGNLDGALWYDPRSIEAHCLRGTVLHGLGAFTQAAAAFRRALQLSPRNAAARVNLGVSLANLRAFEEAENELRAALRLDDGMPQAHYSLGNVLAGRGQWQTALECFRRALHLAPDLAAAHFGAANVYRQHGRFQEALAAFDRALALNPDLRHVRRLRAETLLLLGDLERGWRELPDDGRACYAGPPWPPGRPLPERPRGMAPPALDRALVEHWRRELASLAGYKVAIEWHSDQRDGGVPCAWIDSLTQIPGVQLVRFAMKLPLPLGEGLGEGTSNGHVAPNESLGTNSAVTRPHPNPGYPLAGPEREGTTVALRHTVEGAVVANVASTLDLAAAIANVDLVIATEGTVAHLAGSLGVPLYVALPVVPHCCWFLERTDSPWYASAILFRQTAHGDWTDVCAAIEDRLEKTVRGEAVAAPGQEEAARWCAQAARLADEGELAAAVDCCLRATAAAPAFASAHNNLGAAYSRLGRHREAAAACRLALKRMPFYPEALLNLGTALASLGESEEAARVFRQAVRQRPRWPRAHFYLGNALASLAQWQAARESYRTAQRLDPDDAEVRLNLGVAYRETGQLEESAACLERALAIRPRHAHTLNNLAVSYCRLRLYAKAIECFEEALRRQPNFAAAHNNHGIALAQLERHSEAIDAYHRALAISPDYAEAHNNLGISLTKEGRYEEAVESFARAIELRPDYAEAHNNQGIALKELGRLELALASYNRALELNPDYAEAHLNRAFAWLLYGQFESGWREYEWRLRLRTRRERFSQPPWQGEPLERGTLLIHCEQGLGDTIQFIRYAALAKQRVERVVVRCPARLKTLLGRVEGIDELIGEGDLPPTYDRHVPLLSLPRVLGTTLRTVPIQVPYVVADEQLVEKWRQIIGGVRHQALGARNDAPEAQRRTPHAFLIGVNWQGNAHYQGDRERSFSPACLAPLSALPHVTLVSLQKGIGPAQLDVLLKSAPAMRPRAESWIAHLGADLDEANGAFMDTAAAIMNLDLVVTSDTAIAHLAGALGRPVWVALPYSADWRWLADRSDSPWYPTMRLYRQPSRGDWAAVFERIASDLRQLW